MAAGHITPGRIDGRSVTEVTAEDVAGYERAHFFAGIAGWELACQWAGWDRPIWTASLPCQPFSAAGNQRGADDDRHLWPGFFKLVDECRPCTIVGEQVVGAIRLGWLDAVFDDLDRIGYTCRAIVMGAHSVGAPHIRQRLFWLADTDEQHRRPGAEGKDGQEAIDSSKLGNTNDARPQGRGLQPGENACTPPAWAPVTFIECADGKSRPTQLGLRPLAPRLPGRVGKLRGYGNSIIPALGAEFLMAVKELNEQA